MWWWLAAAWAGSPGADVAPGPAELSAATAELAVRVGRAEAIGRAATRFQNRLGEALVAGHTDLCGDPFLYADTARERAFGGAWRDAAQSADAQSARVGRLVESHTVIPLLTAPVREEIAALRARAEVQSQAYLELRAWDERYIARAAKCTFDLGPGSGLPAQTIPAPGEVLAPVAIVAQGGGTVCTVDENGLASAFPADGGVVILPTGEACVGQPYTDGTGCDCGLGPVDPGAVLYARGLR